MKTFFSKSAYNQCFLNILYNDYVKSDSNQEKIYLILKTKYSYENSKKDGERKIVINGTKCYALEEVDFSSGHKQDYRNWSSEFNPQSGRLEISESWFNNHKLKYNDISYKTTMNFIQKMYDEKLFIERRKKNKNNII